MRKDARGMTIKDDYLARLLSLRWAPELSAYDALYKMAATLVRKSNAFAAVMYIQLESEKLGDMKFRVSLRNKETIVDVMDALKEIIPIKVEYKEKDIYIR